MTNTVSTITPHQYAAAVAFMQETNTDRLKVVIANGGQMYMQVAKQAEYDPPHIGTASTLGIWQEGTATTAVIEGVLCE